MSITLTPETKNTITLSYENKPTGGTFGSAPGRTFADVGTFGLPHTFLTPESKNTLAITNESKT